MTQREAMMMDTYGHLEKSIRLLLKAGHLVRDPKTCAACEHELNAITAYLHSLDSQREVTP